MTFEGERGEHFFRSTLVQTLFYGLFAAWVFWAEQHEPTDTQARFRWREAGWYLHIPILSKLYGDFASPSQLGTMHLEEVLDWAGEALDRVDRASFFATFEQQHAVQYFYEPFLEAFDPELRKQLGVWYTPPEIVKYMVARVDQVLRSELDIADGLADPRVVVLDPCCGTGAYLVEVLNRIAETLHDKGGDALIANDLKKAAMSRVFGFEILPAPFVISHLQIGLALDRFGAPFSADGKERAGVYLSNALTGWGPPGEPKQHLLFPELEMERDAAADVKQKKPILVILGNPPYNAFAGVSPSEESGLVEPYKAGLIKDWGIKKFNLDDLYVRFFRVAERRIAEVTGRGVTCFISNFSYLSDASFVVMRQRLLREFDSIWIDCMNGDSRETGKRAPDGGTDPSVFSTDRNPAGIRLGTAIGLLVRGGEKRGAASVKYRDFWGPTKRSDLVSSLVADAAPEYRRAEPAVSNRYSLRPSAADENYLAWPLLTDLAGVAPISGLQEMRRGALIDIDRARLRLACPLTSIARLPGGMFSGCIPGSRATPDDSRPDSVAPVWRARGLMRPTSTPTPSCRSTCDGPTGRPLDPYGTSPVLRWSNRAGRAIGSSSRAPRRRGHMSRSGNDHAIASRLPPPATERRRDPACPETLQ